MQVKAPVLPFYAKLAFVLVSLLITGYLAIIGKEIISPLLFAFLFSILLLPLANFFERRWYFPRSLSALLCVLLLAAAICAVLLLIGSELVSLMKDWPRFKAQLINSVHDIQAWIQVQFHLNLEKQRDLVQNATSNMVSTSPSVIGRTLLSLSSQIILFIFMLVYVFFLLFYRHLLVRFLAAVFHPRHSTTVYEVVRQTKYIIKRYVVGLFFQLCIVAALTTAVFWIAGIPYAGLLGIFTGLLNVIPYVGIFVALFLSMFITFSSAAAGKLLLVVIAVLVIHFLDSNVIRPRIVGSQVRVNALISVLGVIVGEVIWGVAGMFLSIPIIAIAKIVFDRVEELRPWGLILGEEPEEPGSRMLRLRRKAGRRRADR
ncbi:AI-2E family transporter [Compostibacter hankyongensis]|uniref:AI-2E family transporter n=1 Tax=Compostibacter hankyongensis TaxID=1007089 RepID=A0ABP8FP97_9BACT